MFLYLSFLTVITFGFDMVFTLMALNMTRGAASLVLIMWMVDVSSAVNLFLYRCNKSELKYTGVTVQLRLILKAILSVLTDEMIGSQESKYVHLLIQNKLGISIMMLYIGIYHSLVVKDLFQEESSR